MGTAVGSSVVSLGFTVTGVEDSGLSDEGNGLTGARVTGGMDVMTVGVEVIGARGSMPGNASMLGELVPDVNIDGRLEGAAVTG